MKLSKNTIKIIIGILIVVIIAVISIIIIGKINLQNKINKAEHAITINEETQLYKNTKAKKSHAKLEIGTNLYILEENIQRDGKEFVKVYAQNKVGYILKENVSSYEQSEDQMTLMLDVSKFNIKNSFKNIGEFKAFILNNNIKYIYIRLAGRGYGKKGVLYEDQYFKEYAEACEFIGIPFGFYYIDEAITTEEITEEANVIKKLLDENKYKCNKLPLVIDVENHDGEGRADGIFESRVNLLNEFINQLSENKIDSIVYSNARIADKYLSNVNSYLWLAYYPKLTDIPDYFYSKTDEDAAKNPDILKRIVAWQFTEKGIKSKIEEEVDLSLVYNKFFKKYCNN